MAGDEYILIVIAFKRKPWFRDFTPTGRINPDFFGPLALSMIRPNGCFANARSIANTIDRPFRNPFWLTGEWKGYLAACRLSGTLAEPVFEFAIIVNHIQGSISRKMYVDRSTAETVQTPSDWLLTPAGTVAANSIITGGPEWEIDN